MAVSAEINIPPQGCPFNDCFLYLSLSLFCNTIIANDLKFKFNFVNVRNIYPGHSAAQIDYNDEIFFKALTAQNAAIRLITEDWYYVVHTFVFSYFSTFTFHDLPILSFVVQTWQQNLPLSSPVSVRIWVLNEMLNSPSGLLFTYSSWPNSTENLWTTEFKSRTYSTGHLNKEKIFQPLTKLSRMRLPRSSLI